MKFSTGHAEVQAEGFTQTAAFTIAASGKAFKGLIDGLYSRKIEAVIRELATNAFDAHKAAGSIAPFEVHLPTALKPTFWLRDYGTGMSHDLMMRRYTTMFDSTKDGLNEEDSSVDADDQVGMLGLGSKAFFAYTDSCTISVWMLGEARHYTVFMGANGIPQIALAGTEASDEPTGVKVQFGVKVKDFAEFEKAAIRVFKGFPITPKGLPIKAHEAITVEPNEIGAFWKSYKKDYLPDGGIYARQGCVLYPVDLSQIDDHAVEIEKEEWDHNSVSMKTVRVAELSANFAQFKNMDQTIVIDFPIGALEFDLSRERLAYNDRTVRALARRWDDFIADLDSVFAETFEPLETPWERMKAAGGSGFANMGVLFNTSSYFVEANELWDTIKDNLPKRRAERGVGHHAFFSILNCKGEFGDKVTVIYDQNQYGMPSGLHKVAKSIIVYRDDLKATAVNQRISQWCKTNDYEYAFVLDKGMLSADLFKQLGYPEIVRLSVMPIPPRKYGGGGGGDGPPPFERIKVIGGGSGQVYKPVESEADYEGHLFAFLNCGQVHNPDPDKYPTYTASDVFAMNSVLRYFTGQSISFINVKKNEFTKLDKWDEYPLFYGCLDGILDKVNMKDLRDLVNLMNWERFEHTKYQVALKRWVGVFPRDHDPLADMRRFEFRYNRVQNPRRCQLSAMLDGPVMSGFRDELMERGIAAGLEVLPEMPRANGSWGSVQYPYPLLPKKWEKMVQLINRSPNLFEKDRKFIYQTLKEKVVC